MSVWVSDGPAGTLLRRLMLPVAIIPVALGFLQIRGMDAQLFDRGLGIALFAVSLIVVLAAMLWQTGGRGHRANGYRAEARGR